MRFDADGVGTFASRSTAMAGSALHLAALDLRAGGPGYARFESDLVFGSGAYAAAVEIEADTGPPDRQADRRGRRRRHDHQPAAGRGAGARRRGARARRRALGGDPPRRDGQPSAASFAAYGLPTAGDIPEIRAAFVESPSPRNPLGAKGIGEGGTIGVPAAIGNAVAAALGGLKVNPPYTPEKLYDVGRSPLL